MVEALRDAPRIGGGFPVQLRRCQIAEESLCVAGYGFGFIEYLWECEVLIVHISGWWLVVGDWRMAISCKNCSQPTTNHQPPAYSFASFAMISFMISEAPAPMVFNRASRQARPSGYSVV